MNQTSDPGCLGCLGNIIWLVFGGLWLAITAALNGVLLCVTILGIPFGLQCFKIARLALMPFGAQVLGPGEWY